LEKGARQDDHAIVSELAGNIDVEPEYCKRCGGNLSLS